MKALSFLVLTLLFSNLSFAQSDSDLAEDYQCDLVYVVQIDEGYVAMVRLWDTDHAEVLASGAIDNVAKRDTEKVSTQIPLNAEDYEVRFLREDRVNAHEEGSSVVEEQTLYHLAVVAKSDGTEIVRGALLEAAAIESPR